VLAVVGFVMGLRNEEFQNSMDKLVLKTPVLGKISKHTNLARFARTLALLIRSGMPILESIKVTGASLNNNEYRKAVLVTETSIRSGSSLSASLKTFPALFPPLPVNMITVGEESGNVEEILLEVATFYEKEVDQSVTNLSSVLEPALMVVVGVAVGILAVALIMPIYSITQSI
jgi:type II secretory pathway component PulF